MNMNYEKMAEASGEKMDAEEMMITTTAYKPVVV
jgi:hypothetical protein